MSPRLLHKSRVEVSSQAVFVEHAPVPMSQCVVMVLAEAVWKKPGPEERMIRAIFTRLQPHVSHLAINELGTYTFVIFDPHAEDDGSMNEWRLES